jgi:hypothetical protein
MNIHSLDLFVDLNRDGTFSAWEIWEATKSIYRLPGNLFVEGLGNTPFLSGLLSIEASPATGYASINGLLSLSISLVFWAAVIFCILTLSSPEDDMLETPEATEAHRDGAAPAHDHLGSLPARPAVSAVQARVHLPVSRSVYSAPGVRPLKRRRHNHLNSVFVKHAK